MERDFQKRRVVVRGGNEFLDDLFATATAYEVSREFEGVTCDVHR